MLQICETLDDARVPARECLIVGRNQTPCVVVPVVMLLVRESASQ